MNLCQDCAGLTDSQFAPYMFAECNGHCHRSGLMPVVYVKTGSLASGSRLAGQLPSLNAPMSKNLQTAV